MSSNLDRLLARLKEQADLIDELNTRSDFRHKSIQSLILANGKSFEKQVKSPFRGQPKSCFENCLKALVQERSLHCIKAWAVLRLVVYKLACPKPSCTTYPTFSYQFCYQSRKLQT